MVCELFHFPLFGVWGLGSPGPSTLLPAMALRSGAQQGAGALSATPAPTTAEQGLGLSASLLCIHAAKVKEVKTYLDDLRDAAARAPRLLVLSGPVAAGKTALIQTLCAEATPPWRVEEYECPAALSTHEARLQHFLEWVHHAARYAGLVAGGTQQTLFVVEDVPSHRGSADASRTRDAIAAAAARMALHGATHGAPALAVISSDGGELDRVGATDALLAACGVAQWPQPWAVHVKLNRPTEKMLAKMLVSRASAAGVARNASKLKRRRATAVPAATSAAADAAASAAEGDIRRAITLFNDRASTSEPSALSTADKRLDLFHLLGKVLYNKRAPDVPASTVVVDDAAPSTSKRLELALPAHLHRPPTLVDVPLVLSCCTATSSHMPGDERLEKNSVVPRAGNAAAELSPGSLAMFLHENAPHFVSNAPADMGIIAYANVMTQLSDALHMCRTPPHLRSDAGDALWDVAASGIGGGTVGTGEGAGNVKEACACATAVLGYMFANDKPAPRSWRPLRAPEHYAISRARRDNLKALKTLQAHGGTGAADAACDTLPLLRSLARMHNFDAQRAIPSNWATASIEMQRGGESILVVHGGGGGAGGVGVQSMAPAAAQTEVAVDDDIEE